MRERVARSTREAKNPLLAVSRETSTDASVEMQVSRNESERSYSLLSLSAELYSRCVVFSRSIRFISSSHPSCDLWHPLFFFFPCSFRKCALNINPLSFKCSSMAGHLSQSPFFQCVCQCAFLFSFSSSSFLLCDAAAAAPPPPVHGHSILTLLDVFTGAFFSSSSNGSGSRERLCRIACHSVSSFH